MPTHTAYPVPSGISRKEYARPDMLSSSAPPNSTLGQSLLKPFEAPSAAAHTVSRNPETTRTSQAMIKNLSQ